MTLYNTNTIPLCTLNENDVLGNPRTCGPGKSNVNHLTYFFFDALII
jgi:hypothetical protein